MSVALVPISVDRYLKVCRRRLHKVRISIPIPIICIVVDFFPLSMLIACTLLGVSDRLTNSLYMVIVPVGSLFIVLACNIALFISISHHAKIVSTFENCRRMNETRQIARATCIQAATPLFIQLPSLLGIFSIMGSADQAESDNVILWRLANVIWFMMLLNPLLDALVTLFIVKTYSRALRDMTSRFVPNKCRSKGNSKKISRPTVCEWSSCDRDRPRSSYSADVCNSLILNHH
ncbi:hypothetical protein AB6A40_002975 [Gnathostoma spinigerum]|uniref:G protein-coupled receptor n=1 Tax=Gnathostoma spinigerum TaxID=75299 RepID=A0ABD6E9G2_9BILA